MLATQMGIINLVMRSPEDDQQITSAQAKPSELFATTVQKNRPNESLMPASDPNPAPAPITVPSEKTRSFLELLNAAKAKGATAAGASPAGDDKVRPTWIMRMLKPGGVEEVQFEADDAKGGSSGSWKATTLAGNSGAARPAKDEPKVVAPPAKTPVAPPPEEPQNVRDSTKKDGATKAGGRVSLRDQG